MTASSLLELMVTLVFVSLFFSMLLVSTRGLHERQAERTLRRLLPEAMMLARIQALSHGEDITLCPFMRDHDEEDWGQGWAMVRGSDCDETALSLMRFVPFKLPGRLLWSNFKASSKLTFLPDGSTFENGQFRYFRASNTRPSLIWMLNVAGRLRLVQEETDLV